MTVASVPNRIGNYDLVSFIGRGGMGEVWHAVRPELGMPCVLKVIRPELGVDAEYRAMFLNEARIASQLRNSRIVRVHDMGETRGLLYLVMDRVDGVNLAQFKAALAKEKAGPLSVSMIAYIIGELLEALRYAHARKMGGIHDVGVIHHDITPGNILLSSQGEVLLTDFGIARFAGASTLESRPIGTLRYMAPEQLLGRVSRQSDLYSVGAVLHELLAGQPPLPLCKDPEAQRRALLLDPTPGTGRDDVPPMLEQLRLALLEKSTEKRLRSADAALDMLARLPDPRNRCKELRALYARLVGPASTGMTRYLQQQTGSMLPSFLAPLLERWRAEGTPEARDEATAEAGGADEVDDPSGGAAIDRPWWRSESREANADGKLEDDESRTRRWHEGRGDAGRAVSDAVTLQLRAAPPPEPEHRARPAPITTRQGRVLAPLLHRRAVLLRAAGSESSVDEHEPGEERDRPGPPGPVASDRNDRVRQGVVPTERLSPIEADDEARDDVAPAQRERSGGAPSVPTDAAATSPESVAIAAARPRQPALFPKPLHALGLALLAAVVGSAGAVAWWSLREPRTDAPATHDATHHDLGSGETR